MSDIQIDGARETGGLLDLTRERGLVVPFALQVGMQDDGPRARRPGRTVLVPLIHARPSS
jgi:hypothetical protein